MFIDTDIEDYTFMDENDMDFGVSSNFEENSDFDDSEDSLCSIDFSNASGNFKQRFSSVRKQLNQKQVVSKRTQPISKPGLKSTTAIKTSRKTSTKPAKVGMNKERGKLLKVIVPRDRKLIVEGVSNLVLSNNSAAESMKKIGFYKGEKLNELVLIFNNNSALDFDLELFNPSMPVDYLYSTGLNLNDKIEVAGGQVAYSDVLFNLLSNPTMIANCKFVFAGASVQQQMNIPLEVINKQITGKEKVAPLNMALKLDTLQFANNIVFFDMQSSLNRPFIPNGMDVIGYKVLAGMTVTMAFFYKQHDLKKIMFPEAKNSKGLL